jgi:TetR/AcrR family transcriptional repressor of bet genes
MGRRSKRQERRAQLTAAFAEVLSDHGYAGATVIAVAERAGVSPGLVHHHFRDKSEMLMVLVDELMSVFRDRVGRIGKEHDAVLAWTDGALRLDEGSGRDVSMGVRPRPVRN